MNINLLNDDELAQLRQLIGNSKKIALVCHMNADGDALGSSLAWAEYLRQQGKDAQLIVPDMFPDFLQWLPGLQQKSLRYDKKTAEVKQLLNEADLLCYLDMSTPSRASDSLAEELKAFQGKVLLIDHHEDPDINGDLNISFPKMSSTSEMVFRLIWQLGDYEKITSDMATAIYCGMMTDTGAFTYNSNQPEIFFIISQLLAKGIDKDKIYRRIYHVFSANRLRLWGHVLDSKLKVKHPPYHASYFTISRKDMEEYNS